MLLLLREISTPSPLEQEGTWLFPPWGPWIKPFAKLYMCITASALLLLQPWQGLLEYLLFAIIHKVEKSALCLLGSWDDFQWPKSDKGFHLCYGSGNDWYEEITLQPPSPVARRSAFGATQQGFARNEWSCLHAAIVLQLPSPKENAAEKPVCGRMPVQLNTKRAGSKIFPINQVIRGSKKQWKIVVLVSTLCQVLSEIEKVSAPAKQMEIALLFRDKAELPPGLWPHNYISLSEPSLSTTPHAKQLSGRKSIFAFAPYFSCPKMQMQGQLVPWKTKGLPLINRMLGFLWSHTHTPVLFVAG